MIDPVIPRTQTRGAMGLRGLSILELWLFTVTNPLTGKRRRTTYRLTIEEAHTRYINPEAIPGSLERREVNEQARGHGRTLGDITRPGAC